MKRVELDGARVRALAGAVQNARVCMIGDVCLDLYWRADMRLSRLSRETPHFPLPVVGETASPGGGGNVACNLRALGVGELTVISVIGDDWRGFLLRDCFAKRGIDTGRLIVSQGRVNGFLHVLRRERLKLKQTAPGHNSRRHGYQRVFRRAANKFDDSLFNGGQNAV